eukprot:2129665-Prorocentrum_lima.AAC.1
MTKKYTERVQAWPEVGCGAKYTPWGRGPTMVMEVQLADKEWVAYMIERVPEYLEKEIQKVRE